MTLPNIDNASFSLKGAYFVTGTDTEIGKTTTTAQLVKNIAEQGKSVYAIKPVTAGLKPMTRGKHLAMMQGASINLPMSNHRCLPLRLFS